MSESRYHEEYRNAVRKLQLNKFGCVCRAISSIAQASLTTEQEDMRIGQIFEHQEIKRRIIHLEFTQEEDKYELKQLREQDRSLDEAQIMTLISTIQDQSDTPAGRRLLRMEVRSLKLKPKGIRRFCKNGGQIMISCKLNNEGHAVHIKSKGKKFFAVSDGGLEVRLLNKKYPAIVFIPKCKK